MPRILWRYLLSELLRILLLTSAVLVTVTAFGAAIKPLADDRLLSATQAAKYIALAVVPMLQFALPFSAAFAATITLHRMTTDNEVTAMAASGLSVRRVLAPVAALGVVLLLFMLALTQSLVPRFWALLQRAAAADVTRIFEASIARHEAFQVGRLQIYADDVAVQHDPEGSQADSRLNLFGGAAVELDAKGRVQADVTFPRGIVDVYHKPEGIVLHLAVVDAVWFKAQTEEMGWQQRIELAEVSIPTILEDELVTRTTAQLKALRAEPERFGPVQRKKQALVQALTDASLLEELGRQLSAGGTATLVEQGPEPRSYDVSGASVRNRALVPEGASTVTIVERHGEVAVRRYETDRVEFEPPRTVLQRGLIDLALLDCRVIDLAGRPGSEEPITNKRARVLIPALVLPQQVRPPELHEMTTDELIALAGRSERPPALVRSAVAGLRTEIESLQRDITRREARRYALCATAPLLLMVGAVLALWKRDSLPLAVYLWAFLPAILDLMLISGGSQLLRGGQPLGWAVMWSGNAGLVALIMWTYVRIARN